MVSVPENPLNDVMGRAARVMAANGTRCRSAATIGIGPVVASVTLRLRCDRAERSRLA